MIDFIMWAGGVIVTGIFSLIGWVIAMIFGKLKDQEVKHHVLEGRFDDHRLYAAETFTTKGDIHRLEEKLIKQLDRIEDKMDEKANR